MTNWWLAVFDVRVQMCYGGSAEELSAGSESMRYTGSAVPPRLSCRPATDCHPSYAGTLTWPTCWPDLVLRGERSCRRLTRTNLSGIRFRWKWWLPKAIWYTVHMVSARDVGADTCSPCLAGYGKWRTLLVTLSCHFQQDYRYRPATVCNCQQIVFTKALLGVLL